MTKKDQTKGGPKDFCVCVRVNVYQLLNIVISEEPNKYQEKRVLTVIVT